ncbi:hypothetical protein FUA23_20790 [Neolewinella aurantiaca]|uniref:Uncharacterized protein n=1 Tax=Neolewinella aurantiaca TaxID=2602767 RepID=A0A5C7F3N6_9BACT|nr:hypothetical protein [Neolewinella aurantiaca]TXF85242.1 hypothetical protein FUA23_20790 [Neolewinella aurantiaca]
MKEIHAHIDELVRDHLNDLPLAAPDSKGWDALERELDAPEDLHLRNALTGLAANASAIGWQALENKLDTRKPEDVSLAGKLDNLQPAVSPGSWEILASRLDQENDKAVDAIVSEGLARTTPSVSSGWAALAARLELIGWRRSTIAAWKVTEGSLLLCLILLFFRFAPEFRHQQEPFADLDNGFPMPMMASASEQSDERADNSLPAGNSTPSVHQPKSKTTKTLRPKSSSVRPLVSNQGAQALAGDGAQVPGAVAEETPELYSPESIAALDIDPLTSRMYMPSPVLQLAEVDNSVPAYCYINGFVSPLDVNQVVTPGHIAGEYDISSERRFTTGYTIGGLLDFNKGRNTLQIGVIYSRRSYLPASLKWKYQDYFTPRNPVEGYSQFVYHAIEFPFNYKFTLKETTNWRISARAGMSLSVIAKPEIRDQEEVVAKLEVFEDGVAEDGYGTGSSFLPTPGSRPQPSTQSDFSSESELKDPPKGWFEGGSILANSSFYLGGGVIVERIMNPRWSVYVSPSFGRVIYLRDEDGIGPYRDRIHLGSLRMGSRYRFGGKKNK